MEKIKTISEEFVGEVASEIIGSMIAYRLDQLREQGKTIEEQYSDEEVSRLIHERRDLYEIDKKEALIKKAYEVYAPILKQDYLKNK